MNKKTKIYEEKFEKKSRIPASTYILAIMVGLLILLTPVLLKDEKRIDKKVLIKKNLSIKTTPKPKTRPTGKTPEKLKLVTREVGQILKAQMRSTGDFIEKIHAEQQGVRVYLHITVDDAIWKIQEKDTQKRMAEGIWQIWSRRCVANKKVQRQLRAFIKIYDKRGSLLAQSALSKSSRIEFY
ncbi:MAG: hypothetical protein U9O87_03035 [Verrucomicrobiota bacterium]|nr:hypothetical protein [Verrucomicrobiota bacterium]